MVDVRLRSSPPSARARPRELVGGKRARLPAARRDAQPDALADRSQVDDADLRDERRRRVRRRRRRDRRRPRPIEAIAAGRKAAHAIDALHPRPAGPSPSRRSSSARKDAFRKVTRWRTSRDGCARSPRRAHAACCRSTERSRQLRARWSWATALDDVRRGGSRCLRVRLRRALRAATCAATPTEYERRHHALPRRGHSTTAVDRSHPLIELDPEQVHPVRPLRAHLQRGGRRGAPTASSTAASTPSVRPALGGVAARHRLRRLRPLHRHLPDRRDRARSSPLGQARARGRPSPAPTICHYCGVGCRLGFDSLRRHARQGVARVEDSATSCGIHCQKGALRLRLRPGPRTASSTAADPRRAASCRRPRVDDAIAYAADAPEGALPASAADEVAVFVSPRLTNEEIYLAQKLARRRAAAPTSVTTFARLVNRGADLPGGRLHRPPTADLLDAPGAPGRERRPRARSTSSSICSPSRRSATGAQPHPRRPDGRPDLCSSPRSYLRCARPAARAARRCSRC
ncbi:MAG: hypothetical protein MZW92_20510 [Comamonadaceae bacterium]|nr:hypothetical protein [Comamonadaceae bacterium]